MCFNIFESKRTMKSVFCIMFLCGLLLYVKGEFFEFGDSMNKTCILLNVDASFNLTYTEGNDTQNADLFDLYGAKVIERSSECGDHIFNSILMVRLFPSRESLKFTFSKEKKGKIYMKVDLYVEPVKHFDYMNDTSPFEMKDSADLLVGNVSRSNYSYACRTTEELYFTRDAPFAMTMIITDLHVQAFNVSGDAFGPVVHCEQDLITTPVTPTTTVTEPSNETTTEPLPETTSQPEPQTTLEPENITTHVPETTSESSIVTNTKDVTNATTEPHTETAMTIIPTTTGPKPGVPKYTVKQGDKVCIVLQGNITFAIQYQRKDSTVNTAKVRVPYNAVAAGNCTFNNTDTAQQITLDFFSTSWLLNIIIAEERQSGNTKTVLSKTATISKSYSWQKVKLSYGIDANFVDAKDTGKKFTVETDIAFDQFKADVAGSYKCKAEQSLDIGKDSTVEMVVSNMQYRAFGKTDSSNFPNKEVSECNADHHDDSGSDHQTLGIVLGCVFGGLACIILLAGVVRYFRKRKRNPYENM